MVTQVRNEISFSAHPTAAHVQARMNSYRDLQRRLVALPAVGPDQRRIILHLVILTIVLAAAMVGALAN
jgi:hypothetical protein